MASITNSPAQTRHGNFTLYAWAVLAWNFFVVLWGALVRASGSGAGCGSHWPLCNGEVMPQDPGIKTIIEFAHRMTSGVALVGVLALLFWAYKVFPKDHIVRRMAMLSMVFLVAEALLGAGLVLLQYVADNASSGRAFYLSLHLVNTQFLLAALTLTAWFSRDASVTPARVPPLVAASLPTALLISVTGAIVALGDTLFPSATLAEGMRQDVAAGANILVRLRVIHPVLAILAGGYFIFVALRFTRHPAVAQMAWAAILLVMAQLCAGALNLVMLAPIWMQIIHLAMASLVWLSLVLLAVESGVHSYPHNEIRHSGALEY